MNEYFAAGIACLRNADALRFMMDRFGSYAGRYLVEMPSEKWIRLLLAHIKAWEPREYHRAMQYLRKAWRNRPVDEGKRLDWRNTGGQERLIWCDNVVRHIRGKNLDGAILDVSVPNAPPSVVTYDRFRMPANASEKIFAEPIEFVRTSRYLLSRSYELTFVDMHLDVREPKRRCVVEAMLAEAVKGRRLRKVTMIASKRKVVTSMDCEKSVYASIGDQLARLRLSTMGKSDAVIDFVVCREPKNRKMHDRLLLSMRGGIDYEIGFTRDETPRAVKPVEEAMYKEVMRTYHGALADVCSFENVRICATQKGVEIR